MIIQEIDRQTGQAISRLEDMSPEARKVLAELGLAGLFESTVTPLKWPDSQSI